MKFKTPIPIVAIAKKYGASIIGDANLKAKGINEIHKVQEGDLTFSDHPKYFAKALDSAASIILLNQEVACPPGKALLICDQPFEVYNSIVAQFAPKEYLNDDNAATLIHPSVIIEPNVVIGPQVRIGANTWIQSNVVIRGPVHIGKHVIIQSGAIIGGEAFYFKKYFDHYKKWRSGGRVVIEDRVDIGPSSTIARGVSGDTIIGKGSKLDAQVQIGHGVVLGNNCLLAAQVGIGGKTILEDDVVCYGQVGIAQNLRIGRGAIISAKSGVSKSLKGGKTYAGIPAQEMRSHYQQKAALKQLPEWIKKKGL